MSAQSSMKKIFALIIIGLLLSGIIPPKLIISVEAAGEDWWSSDWPYRKKGRIYRTKVAANLTDFPVLIHIIDSDVASRSQGGGEDIVFVDSSGNKMDHEIEFFNKTSGHLIAWVRFPIISVNADAEFYVYYGNLFVGSQENPSGVWDSSFLAVHHLSEASGTLYDSTSYHNDGTSYGSMNQNTSGKIDGSDEFDGVDDYVELPQVFSTETQFTFSAWINARDVGYLISERSKTQGASLRIYYDSNKQLYRVGFWVNGKQANKALSLGEWHFVVGTFDGITSRLYLDGGKPATLTNLSLIWPSQNMYLGDNYDHKGKFNGSLDEVRISNVARSEAWIKTEYNNQVDPSSFYEIGQQEYYYAPKLSDPSPADGATRISRNPVLSINFSNPHGNQMTVIFMSNASGNWEEIGRHTGGNGVYNQTTTNMNGFNTRYYWRVIAIDNVNGETAENTYSFTTIMMLELKWTATLPAGGQILPVIGDINGDGKMEVVTSTDGYIVALDGSDGSILWTYPVVNAKGVQLADLTNDGIPEILAANQRRVLALFGNGTPYWQSQWLSGEGIPLFPLVAFDIDGDGYPTIYFASEDITPEHDYYDPSDFTGRLTALNHKGEVLASTFVYHPCWGGPTVADYDFDGVFEVYMGDRSEFVDFKSGERVRLGFGMRSWWAENLTSRWNQTAVKSSSTMPVLVDIDGDGKLEVIALNIVGKGLVVLDTANGKIIQNDIKDPYYLPGHATPTVYDIDYDGNLEVILSFSPFGGKYGGAPKNIVVWDLGNWSLPLKERVRKVDANITLPYYSAWPPSVGDVDGDGFMEIIAATGAENNIRVNYDIFIYNRTYDLVARIPVTGAGQLTPARLQDIDDDGLFEVIVGGVAGKILAYDTVTLAPSRKPRTTIQYYSEYRRNAAEYVEAPGSKGLALLNEQPSNGATRVELNPTLSVSVHDHQYASITVVFETNASGTWEEIGRYTGGNGIYNQTTTNMDKYNATYFWAVNATDDKGHWTYKVYKFTTNSWWNAGWQHREKITIDHTKVNANLTSFPVLIDFVDSDLASHSQTDGDDIVFIDASGNRLDHEIESYNSSSGHLIAWVNVPFLSSTEDTILYMYYGNLFVGSQENPAGVWDSGFLAVHHLSETGGAVYDSTSHLNDGTPYGSMNQNASGKIGGGDEFDGVDDYIELPRVFSTETQFTFSAWINAKAGARFFVTQYSSLQGAFLDIYYDSGAGLYKVRLNVNGKKTAKVISLNEWHYVVGTFDGVTARLYLDGGSPSTFKNVSLTWPSQRTYIGDSVDHKNRFKGLIDEVRLSNMSRSQAWITTEYNNQKDPSSFYAIGKHESLPNAPPTATDLTLAPLNPSTTDDLTATYTYNDLDGDTETGTQIRWYKNGLLQPELNDTLVVSHNLTAKGENWYFTVRPCDGKEYGATVTSPEAIILNTPPTIDVFHPPTDPTISEGESQVFNVTYSDPDNDIESASWFVNNTQVGEGDNYTFVANYTSAGIYNVTVIVRDNSSAYAAKMWNLTVYNVNRAPVITSYTPENATPTVNEGESLNFTHISYDPDNDTLSHVWLMDFVEVAYTQNWTYTPDYTAAGYHNVTLTVSDGQLNASVQWNVTVINVNRPPEIVSYTPEDLTPEVSEGGTLEFTHVSTDPDGDALSYSWLLDGIEQVATQNWTYVPNYDSAGIRNVTLVVSDGELFVFQYWNVSVINVNRAPNIQSYYPEIDPTISEGQSQEFNITYSDPDGDNLTVQWYLNGTPTVSTDSYIFEANYTSAGTYNVTVTISDGQAQATRNWTLTVLANLLPEASDLSISPSSPLTTDDLIANYSYNDADGDLENGTEIRWYKNGVLQPHLNDSRVVPANFTMKSEVWNFTVRPKDGKEFGELKASPTVTIMNSPPSIDSFTPTETNPEVYENSTLTFTHVSSDPDNDTLSYLWLLDGTEQANIQNWTYTPDFNAAGIHNVTLVVSDNELSVTKQWNLTVRNVNRPPAITSYAPEDLTTEVYEGESLNFTHTSSDPDEDALAYSWLLDEVEQSTEQNWTYTPDYTAEGYHNVTLVVSDGQSFVSIQWNITVVNVNQAPIIDSWNPLSDSLAISENQTQAFNVTYHDPDADALTVQWLVNSTLTATGDTFVFNATFDSAGTYNITVLVTDPSLAAASHMWTLTVYNVNRPPIIETYAPGNLTPEVFEGESLNFTHTSSDPDNDALSYSWILDGVPQATSQNWTYTPDYTAAGYHNVTLTVSDGQLNASVQWNVTVIDFNRLPSAPTIEIAPNEPLTEDDLRCLIVTPSVDPDGDSVTYVYEWYKNGTLQPELTSDTVPNNFTSKGETWKCVVTPFDGKGYGPSAEAEVTIRNSPPQIDAYTPINTSPSVNEGESLEFTHTSSDPDNDTLTYQWLLDSIFQSANQNWTYAPSYDSAGTHNVTLIVSDGELTASQYWNVSVLNVNQPPQALGLSISPSLPSTTDDLVGNYTYFDADGDLENGTEIRWYRNSALQPQLNDTLTVPANQTSKGDMWYFTVRPKDGLDWGDLQTSPTVTIQNSPPNATDLAISPPSPYTTDNLTATYTYYDVDGDLETETEIRWYKDGILRPQYNGTLVIPSTLILS